MYVCDTIRTSRIRFEFFFFTSFHLFSLLQQWCSAMDTCDSPPHILSHIMFLLNNIFCCDSFHRLVSCFDVQPLFFSSFSLSLLVNTHNIQFSEMGFLSPLDSISVIRSSDITIANVVQRYTWYVLSNRTSPATFICVFELQLYLKANVLVIVLLSNP